MPAWLSLTERERERGSLSQAFSSSLRLPVPRLLLLLLLRLLLLLLLLPPLMSACCLQPEELGDAAVQVLQLPLESGALLAHSPIHPFVSLSRLHLSS